MQFSGAVVFFEEVEELAPKFLHQYIDRYEKILLRPMYQLILLGKTASCNNAMDMRVVGQLLAPRMQDLDDPWCCTEVFGIGGQFEDRLCGSGVNQRIQQLLVGIKQWIKFSRNSKNHMEIRPVNDFRRPLVHPDLFWYSLTAGTVAITA